MCCNLEDYESRPLGKFGPHDLERVFIQQFMSFLIFNLTGCDDLPQKRPD